jgi:hypothetical protein
MPPSATVQVMHIVSVSSLAPNLFLRAESALARAKENIRTYVLASLTTLFVSCRRGNSRGSFLRSTEAATSGKPAGGH